MKRLVELEGVYGTLPDTLTVRTPRGGQHLYFKLADKPIRSSNGKFAPGVDVRGDGGYTIFPPSRRSDGVAYDFVNRTAVAELPETWVKLLTKPGHADDTKPNGADKDSAWDSTDRDAAWGRLPSMPRRVASLMHRRVNAMIH